MEKRMRQWLLLPLLLVACGGKPEEETAPLKRVLQVDPTEVRVSGEGEEFTLSVNCSFDYAVEIGVDWIERVAGSPSAQPVFAVRENPSNSERKATLRFQDPSDRYFAAQVNVVQDGKSGTHEEGKHVVVAYVTSWSSPIPDPQYMTHINYAFGHVTSTFDGVRIDGESRFRKMVELKKQNPALKVLLSVGGWGSGNFSEMASTAARREAFARSCKKMLDDYGADGVDIDWEYPGSSAAGISSSPNDKANYTEMMKAIRSAIGTGKLLTLASSCDADFIDFKAILPYVDFINIMAYDMASAPQHNAPLYREKDGKTSRVAGWYTCDEAVKAHLKAGIPAEKLVLGMPFYGHGNDTYGSFVYYCDIKGPKGTDTEKWDEVGQVPYYANTAGTLTLGFDNVRSIEAKCQYVLDNGLRGGMYWEYCYDNASLDLTKAVARKLL
jgi:chitinase